MLAPLPPDCDRLQIVGPLSDREYRRVAKRMAKHPHVALRTYGHDIRDVDFLRHFPTLRRFEVAHAGALENVDGLAHLPADAWEIGVAHTQRALSLAPLARFAGLRRLYVEGRHRDVEVVSGLRELRSVTLRSVSLPDLSLVAGLPNLRALDLKLGGLRDLGLLSEMRGLVYLELWMVRGVSDLTPVGSLASLEHLHLEALRQVSALPSLAGCRSLRRVSIETVKGLRDLTPLRTAPALEEVLLVSMQHLSVEDVAVLRGHPTLRALGIGLGSARKNAAAHAAVGLPDVTGWDRHPALSGWG
jgi:hypothetical protein